MRAQDYFDTYDYTYDNNGNILSASKNGTVIKNYAYNYANWKDQITDYNGQTITCDNLGNPKKYRDGYNFTWTNGRQLVTVTNGANSYSYTYNADSLRTSKTVNGTTTNYYWSNGILQAQKTGDEYLIFLYDENGSAYGFLLKNGTTEEKYYYIFNAQGDVIGIVDSNGTQVVNYTYGVWGDILSTTGTLASTIGEKNPLRYRGYYYDVETGFYYLQTRYYDPEICRFINADGQISGVGGEILGYNMFAYCMNNPVNMSDPTGSWPTWGQVFTAVVGVAIVACAVAATVAAAPVLAAAVAVGYTSGIIVAGATIACASVAAVCGGSLVGEAVTGKNPVRDLVGQENFDAITTISTAGMLYGMSNLSSISTASSSKAPPNPYGKKGSPAHQAEIAKQTATYSPSQVKYEVKIDTPGGLKPYRFADFSVTENGQTWYGNVGIQLKSGLPCARERYAILDIQSAGKTIKFFPYN